MPLDPWGRQYRYSCLGQHQPQGFDAWSVHGNERRPDGWIGHWEVAHSR